MKKTELRIINALLALSHRLPSSEDPLAMVVSTLASLSKADGAALFAEDPETGELVLLAEETAAGASQTLRFSPPGDELAAARGESRPLRLEGSEKTEPLVQGAAVVLVAPFSFHSRSGVCLLAAVKPGALASLGESFLGVLSETVGLILEGLATTETLREKVRELQVLHEIGRSTASSPNVEDVLTLALDQLVDSFACEEGHLRLKPGLLPGPSASRAGPEREPCPLGCVEEASLRILETGHVEVDLSCPGTKEGVPGILAHYVSGFPVYHHQRPVGSLVLVSANRLSRTRGSLSESDVQPFLESLSAQISMALDIALALDQATSLALENERRLRDLSMLFEINRAQSGTMRLDDVLKIILTAATYGHGLGFNRAALFLMNERTNTLQGMMGVGPSDAEEANRVWKELASRERTLSEALEMALKSQPLSTLDAAVKSVRITVHEDAGILSRTVLEKQAFNVKDVGTDPRVNKPIAARLGISTFATAPMIAEGRVLGVIAVDNLFTGRPIDDRDLDLLTSFANQAALAVHNAQLFNRLRRVNAELKNMYKRVTQSERLAALGEMAASVAHEVRNPIVSVGGFARRLERRLERDDPSLRYTGIIIKEITRLEKFLDEILAFSREQPLSVTEVDVNAIVSELVDFFSEDLEARRVTLGLELDPGLPTIEADPVQLSQVLMNFFSNSLDVISTGGRITIRTKLEEGPLLRLEFEDTGGGVPEELLSEIFKPFFTTKRTGTGLGLPLVHKMIKSHQGTIEVENRTGESITFIARLPLRQRQGEAPGAGEGPA